MDSGIVVQLFLGVLWALGCLLFVTFLLEFREDMLVHPNYPERRNPGDPAQEQNTVRPSTVRAKSEFLMAGIRSK